MPSPAIRTNIDPLQSAAADTINDDTDGVAVINGSVAIGDEAYADYVGSVAIGEHSRRCSRDVVWLVIRNKRNILMT